MAFLKEHDIKQIKEDYNLSTFFETGTGNGEGLEHALQFGFDGLFSAEIIAESASEAREKFGDKVSIINIHSPQAIRSFLHLRQPHQGAVLWFLDAHFPGVDTEKHTLLVSKHRYQGLQFFPIQGELEEIMKGDYSNDVIIIDDAFFFRAGILDHDPDEACPELREAYIGILEKVLYNLSKTHNITVNKGVTGSIVITPKKEVARVGE